eukprot:5822823-Lingulodinium_polyedra.AAC.1
MAQVAQGVDPGLPEAVVPVGQALREVYSDGACADPEDPLVAHAARAIVVAGVGGNVGRPSPVPADGA